MRTVSALRMHHWPKNLLLFAPLIAANRCDEPRLWALGLVAFVSFSLCASSVYILNDVLDAKSDCDHPTKRHRAIAMGTLPLPAAIALLVALLACSFIVAGFLPATYRVVLLSYCLLTTGYSTRLKGIRFLDVTLLAAFYAIRVIAGYASTGIACSPWLPLFSLFLFLSLALVKRTAELIQLQRGKPDRTGYRGYGAWETGRLRAYGLLSGLLAVLVVGLYINSREVSVLYKDPRALWLLCPLLGFWIHRIWRLTSRGRMHCDPTLFALRDGVSYLTLISLATIIAVAHGVGTEALRRFVSG